MRVSQFLKALGSGAAVFALMSRAPAQEPVLANVGRFEIPFDIETSPGVPVEGYAVLFGSQDGGSTWQQLQSVSVSQKSFPFAAPRDGVYAFAVRMTDAQGNLQSPIVGSAPEMEVVVDTTPPELTLELAESAPGQVTLGWRASDSNLVPESLVLEFADGQDNRWKPIRINPSATGQTQLKISSGTVVAVRASVDDAAGNHRDSSAQLVLKCAEPSHQSNLKVPPPPTTGVALGPSPFAGSAPVPIVAPLTPALPQPTEMAVPVIPIRDSAAPLVVTSPAGTSPPSHAYPVGNYPNMRAGVAIPVAAPVTAVALPGSSLNPPADGPTADRQLVSNRVFELAYQLEDVGPSGISAVELFVTENGGRQWFRYGNDTDLRSPMQVDVQGEGTFGFAIRVRNGLGFADPPPQPGEPPTIIVIVDQTAPSIEMPHPTVFTENGGFVHLEWRVVESSSAPVLVRLEYTTTPNGAWTPLFDWQPDPGTFQWPVQPGVPSVAYFRLLARDPAGNVAAAQTGQPVMIDTQRPVARGLRVQAVSNTYPSIRGN